MSNKKLLTDDSEKPSIEDLFKPIPQEPMWRTADGRVMPISEMEDTHLIRSLRLWKSKVTALALGSFDPKDFVLSPWITEKKWEKHRAENIRKMNTDIENLTAEAKKRGLSEWAMLGIKSVEDVGG